jgi:hypothetical protein
MAKGFVLKFTGRYHHPIKNAFVAAGLETRIVYPFAAKQVRQPANPDVKTDAMTSPQSIAPPWPSRRLRKAGANCSS